MHKNHPEYDSFCECRTCYSHLAGIHLSYFCENLIINKFIIINSPKNEKRNTGKLTFDGREFFKKKFNFNNEIFSDLSFCIDGTEKKLHLSGKLGNKILTFVKYKKLARFYSNSRIVKLNNKGKTFFRSKLRLS